ncbi:TPA: hypothetical protein ACN1ND_000274 [Enterococcus faecalis]|nr:hypothetical protein [Enterococcus faecalis]EKQ3613490.1 hypothetical protein [Enterococcus faecalis]
MQRYIWLGNSKSGGSVYWDKKREVPVKNQRQQKNSKNSVYKFTGMFILLIMFRIIVSYFYSKFGGKSLNIISMITLTLFFTITLSTFIYKSLYGSSSEYIDTSFEEAMYAVKSTGYLKNPLFFMLVDKKLHYMIATFVVLATFWGCSQFFSGFFYVKEILRIFLMILFLSILGYIIYLINFKKDNRLTL